MGQPGAMRPIRILVLSAAALALAVPPARAQSSLQCDGGIVSVGDSKLDLLGKCGNPTLVEERLAERWGGSGHYLAVTAEEWTYNFGPNRFLQFVTLVGGKVIRIERGGWGYTPRPAQTSPRARCDSLALRVGDAKIDLLEKCGEPVLRDSAVEDRWDGVRTVSVQVEIWTYDFGPQSFVQSAILENGKVVRVERGNYGYAR